jgi:hypothetical protein
MGLGKRLGGRSRSIACRHQSTLPAHESCDLSIRNALAAVEGFAKSTAGEYAGNIFWIVGLALIVSWIERPYWR